MYPDIIVDLFLWVMAIIIIVFMIGSVTFSNSFNPTSTINANIKTSGDQIRTHNLALTVMRNYNSSQNMRETSRFRLLSRYYSLETEEVYSGATGSSSGPPVNRRFSTPIDIGSGDGCKEGSIIYTGGSGDEFFGVYTWPIEEEDLANDVSIEDHMSGKSCGVTVISSFDDEVNVNGDLTNGIPSAVQSYERLKYSMNQVNLLKVGVTENGDSIRLELGDRFESFSFENDSTVTMVVGSQDEGFRPLSDQDRLLEIKGDDFDENAPKFSLGSIISTGDYTGLDSFSSNADYTFHMAEEGNNYKRHTVAFSSGSSSGGSNVPELKENLTEWNTMLLQRGYTPKSNPARYDLTYSPVNGGYIVDNLWMEGQLFQTDRSGVSSKIGAKLPVPYLSSDGPEVNPVWINAKGLP